MLSRGYSVCSVKSWHVRGFVTVTMQMYPVIRIRLSPINSFKTAFTPCLHFNSSLYIYTGSVQTVLRCFTKTLSLIPKQATMASKNFVLKGGNLGQDQARMGRASCWWLAGQTRKWTGDWSGGRQKEGESMVGSLIKSPPRNQTPDLLQSPPQIRLTCKEDPLQRGWSMAAAIVAGKQHILFWLKY